MREQHSHHLTESAKTIEERGLAMVREHPGLLLILALSFFLGFGFIIAVIYLVYDWLKGRKRST